MAVNTLPVLVNLLPDSRLRDCGGLRKARPFRQERTRTWNWQVLLSGLVAIIIKLAYCSSAKGLQ